MNLNGVEIEAEEIEEPEDSITDTTPLRHHRQEIIEDRRKQFSIKGIFRTSDRSDMNELNGIELRKITWADDDIHQRPLEEEFIIPPRPFLRKKAVHQIFFWCIFWFIVFVLIILWVLAASKRSL
uniref:Uncharacterized protein n=1 Tax=Hanusia phi TaxID=3032 RepID=A0A7S0HUE5_9CRYP|mmetsp:Transcript_33416/g.74946  ORF Transcript_33416/g.74946 Transcript_33416/m.74946 type:complete len:125 (+) Transcript_33416:285-659(+)|eukprot:756758-Hanusia_phi.AAC.2